MDLMRRRSGGGPRGGPAGTLAGRGALAAALALCACSQAHAISLRDLLGAAPSYDGRVSAAPPVARYSIESGGGFVLDRSGPEALLRFDGDDEIWALKASRAARGDVIYRNDLGQTVVRATRLGGVTVFTPTRPSGAPAALEGSAVALEPRPIGSVSSLLQVLAGASVRAGRAARHLVSFEAPDITRRSAALLADTANLAAKAIERRSRGPKGAAAVAKTRAVRLKAGDRAEAKLDHGVLELTVDPDEGVAGRPSSLRIERLLK